MGDPGTPAQVRNLDQGAPARVTAVRGPVPRSDAKKTLRDRVR